MANTSLILSSLDFDTLKQNLKLYLSNQSAFRDYDFEGSNINVLLDVLSYNSYLNSFYMNMIASEMFLDSAQKYDSVVSHAKELNYSPISASSSSANINITFETSGLDGTLYVPKGTRFTGSNENGSYEFVTRGDNYYYSSNDTFTANNLQIYQGSYFQDAFIQDDTQENLLFKLSNQNVDIDSLSVTVVENAGANTYTFKKADNLFGLTSTSEIFFVQGAENNRYEIVFGDNILGRKPQHLSVITAEYVVCNGEDADDVSTFSLLEDLTLENGGSISASITTVSSSNDGSSQENITSVKYNAPRHFATQYRAIATDDYSSLVISKFGGRVDDIVVYGGQDLHIKQYGRVVLCIKPSGSTIASDNLKNEIVNYLEDYIALPNRVIITDPDTFYCHIMSDVQYNTATGTKTLSEIKSDVSSEIITFSTDHLEKFGNDFRYSKFVTHIDDINTSITSNDTQVRLLKEVTPELNTTTSFVINFSNELEGRKTLCTGIYHNNVVLTTTQFTYVGEDDSETTLAQIKDDGNGNLLVYKTINGENITIKSNIGSINYTTGEVEVNNIKISSYQTSIKFLVNTKNKDIIASKNMILYISTSYVTVNTQETIR